MPNFSKDIKYTAEYWIMGFDEIKPFYFAKKYSNGSTIIIDAEKEMVIIDNKIDFNVLVDSDFAKLECINKIFDLGYKLSEIDIQKTINFNGYKINFINWEDEFPKEINEKECYYKSRFKYGIIQDDYIVKDKSKYKFGLFEKFNKIKLYNKKLINVKNNDFHIMNGCLIDYARNKKKIIIPEGVESIKSGCFWDDKIVEEVVLPNSLINIGGDTFFLCDNLKKINIPKNVKIMGNNPFAGCPNLELSNDSKYFVLENGALYNKNKDTIIHFSIKGEGNKFIIPNSVRIIGKHAFFLCNRLSTITIPKSVKRAENNPFSGCEKLNIINESDAFYIKDDVIYNGFRTSVVGALNKIKSKRLELIDGIKTINRNSFWNCNGIEEIVLPESLEDIGYNPFIGCKNIKFICKTNNYQVIDDILYNKDCSKIICCPAWKAVGHIQLFDSIIELERGCFSGCSQMTSINLRNVNLINKSSFSNCINLEEIYCSDLITFIGEWAFSYCNNLKKISFYKDTFIDLNAFSQCGAKIIKRNEYNNYLIESNNIFTLKSMQKRYFGKIDSICIDPPYNSNIDYINYKDGNYDEGYLNFIKERIGLAYKLLSKQGFLIINIDEGEVNNLKELLYGWFGKNLVSIHKWKKKHNFFDANRVVINPNKIQTDYEYIIICRKTNQAKFNQIKQPYISGNKLLEKNNKVPEIFDCFGTTSSAKDEMKEVFGDREYFSTPKPLKLIKEFIRATTNKDSIILDFFAGSGTVGHAVFDLNKEDKGNRSFILVNNNESNICKNVTKKRLDILKIKYIFLE